jgi:hypothetical protein
MTHDWQEYRSHRALDRDALEWAIKELGWFWAHVVPFDSRHVAAWVWDRVEGGRACRWLGIYPDCATARRACERVLERGRR